MEIPQVSFDTVETCRGFQKMVMKSEAYRATEGLHRLYLNINCKIPNVKKLFYFIPLVKLK